jgi:predicted transport protein
MNRIAEFDSLIEGLVKEINHLDDYIFDNINREYIHAKITRDFTNVKKGKFKLVIEIRADLR